MNVEAKVTKYKLDQLKSSDVVSESQETIYDLLRKAVKASVKEGIEANSILIDKNIVKVNEHFNRDVRRLFPPMICGLNVCWSEDELPDGYSFAIFESPFQTSRSDRLDEFEAIGMEPAELKKAAEMYRYFKKVEGLSNGTL